MEQHRGQRRAEHEQPNRAGHRKQEGQAQAPVEQARVLGMVARGVGLGQARQQDRPQRHAQQRGRELHQPVGIGQVRDAARGQPRGDIGIDDLADLRHRHGQQRRPHLPQDAAHAGIRPRRAQLEAQPRHHAQAPQRRHLDRQLQHAANQHAPRLRVDRLVHVRADEQGRDDQAQVQQHRREGRHRELAPGIEDAGRQRHQRDQADIREHHPRHEHGRGIGLALPAEAGGDRGHHERRPDHAKQ
ncbi:hypothetical protein D9M72_456410 [compost metagenome]